MESGNVFRLSQSDADASLPAETAGTHSGERQDQPRQGAAACRGFQGDRAAVELGGFPDEGETEAGALALRGKVAQRVEALEDLLPRVVGNAGPGIADG